MSQGTPGATARPSFMRAPSSESDAPLGTFEEQVLLAVLRTGRAPDGSGAYGMAVRREVEAVTGREVAIGAVYATLDRLEAGAGRLGAW